MLSAKTKEQRLIQLLHLHTTEIEKLKQQNYWCPLCNESVFIKNGKINQPHFAHRKGSLCPASHQGETEEHRALKRLFARWCKLDGLAYKLEHYLPNIQQRPDILIGNLAIEVQCSALSIRRLVERTQAYRRAGYVPVWICGNGLGHTKHSLSYLGKNFCSYSKQKGFYFWEANLEKQTLCLSYHLEENQRGELYSLRQRWPFFEKRLLDVLNEPFIQRKQKFRTHPVGQLTKRYYCDLMKKLKNRNEKVRRLQSILYSEGLHLLQLPLWFYYPGLRLFGCHQSEILLKLAIWCWLQRMDRRVIHLQELRHACYTLLFREPSFFYELPMVSQKNLFFSCFRQLLLTLIHCRHLSQKSETTWLVTTQNKQQTQASMQQALTQIEKKTLISAIPIQSMIRLF